MIGWIHEGCKHWGWQMRLLYLGKDGWPSRGVLGKMIEDGALGASASRFMQFFPECLDADALKYNVAIKRLSERDREILFIDYAVIGKSKIKAARIGIAPRTYFDRRDQAQLHLMGVLAADNPHKIGQISAAQNYNELALCRA